MKQNSINNLILLLNQIFIILTIVPIASLNNQTNIQFNAVYRIDYIEKGYPLIIQDNKVLFSTKKEGKEESFRIISTGKNPNSFYIISKPFNKKVGINDKGELILYDINELKNIEKTEWNFIQISNNIYLIQNSFNKKYIEVKGKKETEHYVYYPMCISDINKAESLEKISKVFKYSFLKLCEEVQLKPEHIEIIDREPIDVLIKYIDLSDKTLNREGITQIQKDEDNEELRYAVRSILQYIPWIRKIFILMPNEKVKYFKSVDEINNKIIYVKDKDVLGFDSANSVTFQFNLFNMKKFGLSENFILMDDDYFFGKPIKKTEFFYYDENLKKVLPSVITDDFTEMIQIKILKDYELLFKSRRIIKPHSFQGWKISQLASYKLLLEQYQSPLINAGFSHNAIPLNINDLIEVYDLIKNKYEFEDVVLTAKVRTVYDLQPQSLFNSYALNVKKRKVNSIPYAYYDIVSLDDKNFDIELFVLNTSGDRKYTKAQFNKLREVLINKFPIPTPFEIENSGEKITKSINLTDYVKIEECITKDEYDKLKKELDSNDKITQVHNEVEKKAKEKITIENYLKKDIIYMQNSIKEINNNINKGKYVTTSILDEVKDKELLEEEYNEHRKSFQLMVVLLLVTLVVCLLCLRYLYHYMRISEENKD